MLGIGVFVTQCRFPRFPGPIGIDVEAAVKAAYRLTSKGDLSDGLWRLRHNTADSRDSFSTPLPYAAPTRSAKQ
jgi:hypothetical protein